MGMSLEKTLILKENHEKCSLCSICPRLRILELGVSYNQKIKIKEVSSNLFTLSLMDEKNLPITTLGLRKDEIESILLESECIVDLI